MDDIRKALAGLGLKPKEVELYLLLLTLGTVPASAVGKRLDIPKGTARYMCLELVQKGFASSAEKQNVMYYTAEPPKNILLLLEKQRWEIDQRESKIRSVLEPLQRLIHPDAAIPKMRSFEGRDGIRRAWDEVLLEIPEGSEILAFVRPLDDKEDVLNIAPLHERFMKGRVKKKIMYKGIAADCAQSYRLQKTDKAHYRETRILKGHSPIHPTEIMLYNDKIYTIFVLPTGVFATIIQNESGAAVLRMVFEYLWKTLEER